jgi:hypothetical protein
MDWKDGVLVLAGENTSIRPFCIEASSHPTRTPEKEKAQGFALEDNSL